MSNLELHSLGKSTSLSFSDFKLYAAVKLKWLWRRIYPTVWGTIWYSKREPHALQHHWKESKVSSPNYRDKSQFKNSVKRLVFDLTKLPFLERLISISRLIVKVLNDQHLFTESNLTNWFSNYVQFCSGDHFSERAEASRASGKINYPWANSTRHSGPSQNRWPAQYLTSRKAVLIMIIHFILFWT